MDKYNGRTYQPARDGRFVAALVHRIGAPNVTLSGLISLFLRERYEAELRSILTEKDLEAHYGLEVK